MYVNVLNPHLPGVCHLSDVKGDVRVCSEEQGLRRLSLGVCAPVLQSPDKLRPKVHVPLAPGSPSQRGFGVGRGKSLPGMGLPAPAPLLSQKS